MPFDFPAPATAGQVFEPNGPGTQPVYTYDGAGWNYGTVTNLLISSLVPNAALVGSAAATVIALGANFTATCELLWDGVPRATTFGSTSELSCQVDPSIETAPRVAIVTVRDGATVGAGAVPFNFRVVTTYDWRIGIDETAPGIIDVRIANTNGDIGGVTTAARDAAQGLAMDAGGLITVPLATDLLAGSIVEPLPDDLFYVRTRSAAGVSSWVPEAGTDFGTGLTLDETATPPIVHLQPAGNTADVLGGVFVPVRDATQGLELATNTGLLTEPLATDLLAGSIVEPPPDDKHYLRSRSVAGVSAWVATDAVLSIELIIPNTAPVGAIPLTVEVHGTKFTATTVALVDGAAKATTYVSPTELTFQIDPSLETVRAAVVTVQDTVGPVNGAGDAPFHFIPSTALYRGLYSPVNNTPDIWAARQLGYMWIVDLVDPMIPEASGVPGLAGLSLNEGDHLVYDGAQYNVVDGNQKPSLYQGWWKVATNVPAIDTMVKYPGYMWIADTSIPNTPESPPAGFPDLAGQAIYEGDMIVWDGLNFKLMQGVLTPNYRGLWNVATNTPPIDTPPVGNNKPNWMWIAKTVNPAVPEMAPATMPGIGSMSIHEGDHIVWDKPGNAFMLVSGNAGMLEPPDDKLHARRGGTAPGWERTVDEAPLDGLQYAREDGGWVAAAGTVWTSDTPPPNPVEDTLWWHTTTGELYVYYNDGNTSQWVEVGEDTTSTVWTSDTPPPSPTEDQLWWHTTSGKLLIYYNDGDSSQWVECISGASGPAVVVVSDTAPTPPTPNMLWWNSADSNMYLWYTDANSSQWVQVNGDSKAKGDFVLKTGDTMSGPLTINADLMANSGIKMGSQAQTSPSDLSRHLDLYGGIFGQSVTGGTMNYVVPAPNKHSFLTLNTEQMSINSSGVHFAGSAASGLVQWTNGFVGNVTARKHVWNGEWWVFMYGNYNKSGNQWPINVAVQIGTLQTGYRPATKRFAAAASQAGGYGGISYVTFNTDGGIWVTPIMSPNMSGGPQDGWLDGIVFRLS